MTTTARRLLTTALTAVLMVLGALSAAPSASAYTWNDGAGRAGYVALSKAQGVHLRICATAQYYTCRMAPGINVPAQRVYRSPMTSGRQDIVVVINILRFDGDRWYHETGRTWYGTIPAGVSSVVMPEWTTLPNRVNYLRVNIGVGWANPYGQTLGTRFLSMNQQGDYECATNLRPCTAGAGWLYIREPGV